MENFTRKPESDPGHRMGVRGDGTEQVTRFLTWKIIRIEAEKGNGCKRVTRVKVTQNVETARPRVPGAQEVWPCAQEAMVAEVPAKRESGRAPENCVGKSQPKS